MKYLFSILALALFVNVNGQKIDYAFDFSNFEGAPTYIIQVEEQIDGKYFKRIKNDHWNVSKLEGYCTIDELELLKDSNNYFIAPMLAKLGKGKTQASLGIFRGSAMIDSLTQIKNGLIKEDANVKIICSLFGETEKIKDRLAQTYLLSLNDLIFSSKTAKNEEELLKRFENSFYPPAGVTVTIQRSAVYDRISNPTVMKKVSDNRATLWDGAEVKRSIEGFSSDLYFARTLIVGTPKGRYRYLYYFNGQGLVHISKKKVESEQDLKLRDKDLIRLFTNPVTKDGRGYEEKN